MVNYTRRMMVELTVEAENHSQVIVQIIFPTPNVYLFIVIYNIYTNIPIVRAYNIIIL